MAFLEVLEDHSHSHFPFHPCFVCWILTLGWQLKADCRCRKKHLWACLAHRIWSLFHLQKQNKKHFKIVLGRGGVMIEFSEMRGPNKIFGSFCEINEPNILFGPLISENSIVKPPLGKKWIILVYYSDNRDQGLSKVSESWYWMCIESEFQHRWPTLIFELSWLSIFTKEVFMSHYL